MYDPYEGLERTVMANGLTVYCLPMKRSFVEMSFIVHAGDREDPKGKEGLLHFLEHLVSENMPGYPTDQEREAFFLDSGGGVSFGSTSSYDTVYTFKLPSDEASVTKGLDMFSSMLCGSKIVCGLEKEREVIVAEFWREYRSRQRFEALMLPFADLLPDHRRRHSSCLGTPESIAGIGYDDLQRAYDAYYVPANMTVVCVGGMNMKELSGLIMGSGFGTTPSGVRNKNDRSGLAIELGSPAGRINFWIPQNQAGTASERVRYSSLWVIKSTLNTEAVYMVKTVLSRMLHDEIREKRRLTYDVSCRRLGHQDFDFLLVETEIEESGLSGIDDIVMGQVRGLRQISGIILQERIRIKKSYAFADPSAEEACDRISSDISLDGKVQTLQEVLGSYDSVTAQDIIEVIDWLEGPHRSVLVSLP
jgi:predicted Zn-dependent peptidase